MSERRPLGRNAIGEFMATGFARGASFCFAQTRANGQPALGAYRRRNGGAHRFGRVQVLTITETASPRSTASTSPGCMRSSVWPRC